MKIVRGPERRPLPREIFEGERADDVPLPLVRVLRLVDQDMIGLAVELVADPVAHAGFEQQCLRLADQVVEIDHAGGALGGTIGPGIGLPDAQPGGERRHHGRGPAQEQKAGGSTRRAAPHASS